MQDNFSGYFPSALLCLLFCALFFTGRKIFLHDMTRLLNWQVINTENNIYAMKNHLIVS